MKKSIFFGTILSLLLIAGCSKDNASAWVGTYNGTSVSYSLFNRVLVGKVEDNTVQLQLQASGYTFATVQHGMISGSNVTINEDGLILGYTDTYHFSGSGTLSGNNISLAGVATNKSNSSDVRYYTFTGTK